MESDAKLLKMELNGVKDASSSNKLTNKVAFIQVLTAMMANFSVLAPGMGMAFPAITSEILMRDEAIKFTASQASWFASITPLHCPFGGPLSSYLVTKIGRKGTLIVINILSMIHWTISGLSSSNPQILYIQLLIARIITGFTIGMSTTPSVMYSTEISHPRLKSKLAVLSAPFWLSNGALLIYFLGYLTGDDFRLASLYALGISAVSFVISLIIPESPTYLVANNKIKKAQRAIEFLKNCDKDSQKVHDEIRQIQEVTQSYSAASSNFNLLKEFRKPEFYKPFLIMSSFFIIQQLSGIFMIFILAAKISLEAGVAMDEFLSTVIMGIIRVVMTFIISLTMNRFARRQITIISASGMSIAMFGLVVSQVMSLKETSLSWLPEFCLFSYCIFGVPGVLTLPFSMVGDVYQQQTKSYGIGMNIFICFFFVFTTVKFCADAFDAFGSIYVFGFSGVVSAIGILFGIFILPETKGKSPQDMEKYFKGK